MNHYFTKPLYLSVYLLLLMFNSDTMAGTLDQYQWKNRIIVAFVEPHSFEELAFKQSLNDLKVQFDERDIVVFLVSDTESWNLNESSNPLDQQFTQELKALRTQPGQAVKLLLIGKDGGIKAQAISLDKLPNFLDLIDTMPMRRAEAARQKLSD